MRLFFHPFDPFILLLMTYFISDLSSNWSKYDNCKSPSNIFLMGIYSLILLHRVLYFIKANLFRMKKVRNITTLLIYCGVYPAFIYWTFQGIKWQIANDQYTPNCVGPNDQLFINRWLGAMVVLDCLIIVVIIAKIVQIYALIQYRRRLQTLLARLAEYEEETLHRILLMTANDLQGSGGNGLTYEELERIEREKYQSSSIGNVLRLDDTCPVCFEEFNHNQDIMRLPGCRHAFHPNCIQNWLVQKPVCPVCRSNVREKLYPEGTGNMSGAKSEEYTNPVLAEP